MLELNKIYNEDCLGDENKNTGMWRIPDKSVDMILADLPYGTTKAKWDTPINLERLWKQYLRIIKDNGAIVLFGQEPFASTLRNSNQKLYKYDWYWKKSKPSGFANAKRMPLKDVETISIFYKKLPTYNPQGLVRIDRENNNSTKQIRRNNITALNGGAFKENTYIQEYTNYPRQILEFSIEGKPMHNTQKPVPLFEYLIKTYTNEGETVLDSVMGSGTTAIACINTNRNYIGFELEKEYYDLANERIEKHLKEINNT